MICPFEIRGDSGMVGLNEYNSFRIIFKQKDEVYV
jgi:hypothetical protein